jgi:hypothetical protein
MIASQVVGRAQPGAALHYKHQLAARRATFGGVASIADDRRFGFDDGSIVASHAPKLSASPLGAAKSAVDFK